MKKIYLVYFGDDCGELWLDENKKPLSYVHCRDANFREEYQSFIIKYLGGKLVTLNLELSEEDQEKLYDTGDSKENIYKIVKKYIK